VYAPTPRPRPAPQQVPVPSVFTPTPHPPAHAGGTQYAPDPQRQAHLAEPQYAPAPPPYDPHAPPAQPPARPGGTFGRAVRAVWEFTLTTAALAMFVGAWWLAVAGALEPRRAWLWAGTAATIFCTPFALHRLTSRRGRLGFGVIGSLGASLLGWRLAGRAGMDHAITLAAIFGLQVLACFLMTWLTRRREPHQNATS
jgi:hypothetical protein